MTKQSDDRDSEAPRAVNPRRQQVAEQLRVFHALLCKHGAPIIRAATAETLRDPKLCQEEIAQAAEEMREQLTRSGASSEDVESAVAEVREHLGEFSVDAPETIERLTQMFLKEAAELTASSLMNALHEAASRRAGAKWIRQSLLGPDMLPMSDREAVENFGSYFSKETVVSSAIARRMLRAVAATLPPGKKLPDCVVSALDLAWGIVVAQ